MPLFTLRGAVLFAGTLPFVYYALAIYSARRYFKSARRPTGDYTPPVSILKPIRGLDRATYENFVSFCHQDYPDYEIVFAVADSDDPSIELIRRLMNAFPQRSIRLLVGAPNLGPSSKVNKLCRLVREARHDILVISDSDVRVCPDYLRAVVDPFRDPRVGAVTCLYTGVTDGSVASELEALGIATDFAPGVLTAWQLGDVRFALGATMATTRDRLHEIGGFEALVTYCADDFQLGYRIAERGYVVELSHSIVESECAVATIRDYLRHQLRWAISTRHSSPSGYAGLALTQGLPWAVVATMAMPSEAVAAFYFGTYLALRVLMAWSVARRGLRDQHVMRNWWLLPVRDALAFGVWLAAFFQNRIYWRGRRFLVHDGRLFPITAP
jgi:ceramide glucosyltransferase